MPITVTLGPSVTNAFAGVDVAISAVSDMADQGDLVSATSTTIVLETRDAGGVLTARTTVTGTGFAFSITGELISGTITGIDYDQVIGGTLQDYATFTNLSLSATVVSAVIEDEATNPSSSAWEDLLFPLAWDITGTNGADTLFQFAKTADGVNIDLMNNDKMTLLGGNDVAFSSAGNDTLFGGAGKDKLGGETGADSLYGGNGDDTLFGGGANDKLFGGTKNDKAYGGAGADLIRGGANNDKGYGGAGNDKIYGEKGVDSLYGGNNNDSLFGGGANDRLFGGKGIDREYGGAGKDTLDGGGGNDTLFGGSGNDLLKGGTGNDTYWGGAGADVFDFTGANQGSDVIGDWQDGIDKISGVTLAEISVAYSGGDTVVTYNDGTFTIDGQIITFGADDFV